MPFDVSHVGNPLQQFARATLIDGDMRPRCHQGFLIWRNHEPLGNDIAERPWRLREIRCFQHANSIKFVSQTDDIVAVECDWVICLALAKRPTSQAPQRLPRHVPTVDGEVIGLHREKFSAR